MDERQAPLHYVCTREEGKKLIGTFDRFWISNCGCRESRGKCERSRVDLCLQFCESTAADGSGIREATREEAEAILTEAEARHLVVRPFRDEATKTKVEGICFCCDDCCGYFTDPEDDECEKGSLIEETDLEECSQCGLCAEVCYFGARKMVEGELQIDREKCYGCSLCLDVCPVDCIKMGERAGAA